MADAPAHPSRTELKAKARALYFEHYPLALISKQVGIRETILKRWIYGTGKGDPTKAWVNQRRERERELAETLVEDNGHQIQKLFRISLPIIVEAVMERHKDSKRLDPKTGRPAKPISISEAKALTDIMTDLDGLVRLAADDANKRPPAPPGTQQLPAGSPGLSGSMEAIREAIHQDKFLDITPIKQGKHKSSLTPEERRELFKKPDEQLYGDDELPPAADQRPTSDVQRAPAATSGQPAGAGIAGWEEADDRPGTWDDDGPGAGD